MSVNAVKNPVKLLKRNIIPPISKPLIRIKSSLNHSAVKSKFARFIFEKNYFFSKGFWGILKYNVIIS